MVATATMAEISAMLTLFEVLSIFLSRTGKLLPWTPYNVSANLD
jgi:hypothetical protein